MCPPVLPASQPVNAPLWVTVDRVPVLHSGDASVCFPRFSTVDADPASLFQVRSPHSFVKMLRPGSPETGGTSLVCVFGVGHAVLCKHTTLLTVLNLNFLISKMRELD